MKRTPYTQFGTLTTGQMGTNDVITLSDSFESFIGDAFGVYDGAIGGNDRLTATGSYTELYGDAYYLGRTGNLADVSRGGNDVLIGASRPDAINLLDGDAYITSGSARGGNDVVYGGGNGAQNYMYGDGTYLLDAARGGNDQLIGGAGAAYNEMYGDAFTMRDKSRGGDDVLVAGDGAVNSMSGDAYYTDAGVQCGKDRLVSGTGNDLMYGDYGVGSGARGNDIFVFGAGNGQDVIGDFRSFSFGEASFDRINVRGLGITSINQLDIEASGVNTVIDFGGGNQVTLLNFDLGDGAVLSAGDFIFA